MSGRIHSYVSPSSGLLFMGAVSDKFESTGTDKAHKGFLDDLYLLPEAPETAKVATQVKRSTGSSVEAARSSNSLYSSSSAILCSPESGSFIVTGKEMVERSCSVLECQVLTRKGKLAIHTLPTFFRSMPSIENSSPVIGEGSLVLLGTASTLTGASALSSSLLSLEDDDD